MGPAGGLDILYHKSIYKDQNKRITRNNSQNLKLNSFSRGLFFVETKITLETKAKMLVLSILSICELKAKLSILVLCVFC